MAGDRQMAQAERFYYADGKKVSLVPSSHYVTVRAAAEPGTLGSAPAALAETLAPSISSEQLIDLPEYELLVIETPDVRGMPGVVGAAESASDAVRSFIAAQSQLSLGPEVYETAASPSGEGLIAVDEVVVKFKPGVTGEAQRKLLSQHKAEVRLENYPEPGAYLVTTKENQDVLEVANRLHESDIVEYAQPNFVRLIPRLGPIRTDAPVDAAFVETPAIEGEPTTTIFTHPTPAPVVPAESVIAPVATPTDPNFSAQWGLRKIKAPEAFDISMGSASITVAVLDEGCDLTHEDISYRLPGYDALTRTNNPQPQPADGHGTSCAGIVAAVANNGRGGVGVAPNCKILPVRIARGDGRGRWITSDAIIADAIRTAVNRGADVLSNSWGGGAPSSAITSAFQFAQTNGRGGKGCPIAIASGNGDVRGVSYPATLSPAIPGLMAVGASNQWDQRKSRTSLDGENWWGSNYGPEIDVVAPGVQIFTTDIMGGAGYAGGNYVPNFNGTSSATPHVAGLMGLLLSVDPDLRSWEVEELIKLSADHLGPAGRNEEFGFGRINARRALEAVSRIWSEISVAIEFLGSGKDCYMRMNVRLYNPGINTVHLNGLVIRSYGPDGTTEIDRCELLPTALNLAPRSATDVRLNRVLLRANGNQSSWSYRWTANWWYTFWRPGGPVLPLSADGQLAPSEGRSASAMARGSAEVLQSAVAPEPGRAIPAAFQAMGNTVTVDMQAKTITITMS